MFSGSGLKSTFGLHRRKGESISNASSRYVLQKLSLRLLRNPYIVIGLSVSICAISIFTVSDEPLPPMANLKSRKTEQMNASRRTAAVSQKKVTIQSSELASAVIGIEVVKEPKDDEHKHNLSVNKELLKHLKSLPTFPKKVHIIWPDKNIMNTDFEMLEYGAKRLQKLNPDWEVLVHDYESVDNTIQGFNHPDIPGSFHQDLKDAHIVEKADAFRLIVMYQTGGIYVDIDRVMNVDLSTKINSDTKLVLPTYYDINFTNDLFGSSPKNELFLKVLKLQCEAREKFERKEGWLRSSDQMSLVNQWTGVLENELFGRRLQDGGDKEKDWDEARHVLNEHSNRMIVTQKDMWCDGLLITDYPGCKGGNWKEVLYEHYNITHWVDQVNKHWEN